MPSNSLSIPIAGHGVLHFTRPDAAIIGSLESEPLPHQSIVFEDATLQVNAGDLIAVKGSALLQSESDPQTASALLGVSIDIPADAHLSLIQFGLNAQAAASGAAALAPSVMVSFSAQGAGSSKAAVARIFRDGVKKGADELHELGASWKLPAAVAGVDDLPPGTWLLADVEGSIETNTAITYGLNYNWVRAAKLNDLSGDVGLKLELGATAALSLQLSGSFVVCACRENLDSSSHLIRVQVRKASRHGFNLSLHTGATIQADLSKLLPDQGDDFLRAIFGVTPQQVLRDLSALEHWAGGETTLGGILGQVGTSYAKELLKNLTGVDAETQFSKAKSVLTEFLHNWTHLEGTVGPLILKLVEQRVNLSSTRAAAELLATGDLAGLARSIRGGDPTVIAFLESVTGRNIFSLLDSGPILEAAKPIAAVVLRVLDGSLLQNVLVNLQTFIAARLQLEPVIAGLKHADFAGLDRMLQAKLAGFLDKAVADIGTPDLETLRKAVKLFLSKRQEFYLKAVELAQQAYSADLSALYEFSTEKTAMIDVTLDMSHPGNSRHLRSALRGDFTESLVPGMPGITLHEAALTHGIKRHTHLEIHLPHFIRIADHLNQADASLHVVDGTGSVLVSALGSDQIEETGRVHNRRNSTLSVAARFAGNLDNIAVFGTEGLSYTYRLEQICNDAGDLDRQIQTYSSAFFSDAQFQNQTNLLTQLMNEHSALCLNLQLSVPASIAASWFVAAPDERIAAKQLSRAIQTSMRRIVPFFYFQNKDNWTLTTPASALLLYSALPSIARERDNYFDFEDPAAREKLIESPQTASRLRELLRATRTATGSTALQANQVTIDRVAASIHSQLGAFDFHALLFTEAEMIKGALKARKELREFGSTINHRRADAMLHLAEFLSQLTETFHARVSSIYGTGALRPLGTLIFLQTCFALMPTPPAYANSLLPDLVAATQPVRDEGTLRASLELSAGNVQLRMVRGF